MLFHMSQTADSNAGAYSYEGSMEWWVDAERTLVRREMTRTLEPMGIEGEPQTIRFEGTAIMIDGAWRTLTSSPKSSLRTTPAQACHGVSEAVSVVLGCPGFTEESTTSVDRASYAGQPVIVLVKTGTASGSDERSTFTEHLYLDQETMLPIAREITGTLDYGQVVPLSTHIKYEHDFIPRDTVPPDFFDPLTLVEARLAELETDIPIYWLGTHFEPEGSLPSLVISDGGEPDVPDPEYEAIVSYHLAGDQPTQFAPGVVLQEWSREVWVAGPASGVSAYWAKHPCHELVEIELPDGHATIFLSRSNSSGYSPSSMVYEIPGIPTAPPPGEPACSEPEEGYTVIEAVVEFEGTVVFLYTRPIEIPRGIPGIEERENPYLTREGIEMAIRGLHAR